MILNIYATETNDSISMIPSPPTLNAHAYILMDYDSGQILAEKNMDQRLPPASLTKLMTAYIIENMLDTGQIKWQDQVTISQKAWRTGGSTMFLEPNTKVSVEDLMKGLIIVSGNDAAVALAEYVAGSEQSFVKFMNSTAKKMQLHNTHFEDANGLPNTNHYSSAHDIATIARHIIHDHEHYYFLYKIKEFQYGINKKTGEPLNPQPNRLSLLFTNHYVDGLKTGHTKDAGYCLAASALQDERRLIAVVMKANSNHDRDTDAQKLLDYGYRFFTNIAITKTETLQNIRIWQGEETNLNIEIPQNIWITIPQKEQKNIIQKKIINQEPQAPISKGQVMGTLQIILHGEILKQIPLIATKKIEKGGIIRRIKDQILLFFNHKFKK